MIDRQSVRPCVWARRAVRAGALCLALAGSPALQADAGAPLPVRNLTPATALYGLPRVLGDVLPGTAMAFSVEHVNNFTGDASDHAAVAFDGTTSIASLSLRAALGRGSSGRLFEWGVEIPYVHHDGGFTDGLIDGFHELFGFPDAGRDEVPRDQLRYWIGYADSELVDIQDTQGDLGDVRGWLGYRLHAGSARRGVVRLMVKAPTGELRSLSGSGGTDVALWGEWIDDALLAALGARFTAAAGMVAAGDGDLPAGTQEDLLFTGHLGVHFPVTGWLTLRGQLDAHSRILDTGLRQLAEGAVQGTLGGTLNIGPSAWLDLGLSEDLSSASAPDVVFLMRLGVAL